MRKFSVMEWVFTAFAVVLCHMMHRTGNYAYLMGIAGCTALAWSSHQSAASEIEG